MPNQHVIIEDESHRRGFTQIPNAILRNPDIGLGAKVVSGLLLSYARQTDEYYPSQERIATDMGVTERSVVRRPERLPDRAASSRNGGEGS